MQLYPYLDMHITWKQKLKTKAYDYDYEIILEKKKLNKD